MVELDPHGIVAQWFQGDELTLLHHGWGEGGGWLWSALAHTYNQESCRTFIILVLLLLAQPRASRGDTKGYSKVQEGLSSRRLCAVSIWAASEHAEVKELHARDFSQKCGILNEATRDPSCEHDHEHLAPDFKLTEHKVSWQYQFALRRNSISCTQLATPLSASVAHVLAMSPTGRGTEQGRCRESHSREAAPATAQLPSQLRASLCIDTHHFPPTSS